jgi:hypothetical protein
MREETHEKFKKPVRTPGFAPSVGRWPLMAVAVVGGLLMCAPQAHAGSWSLKVDISQSGTTSQSDGSSPTNNGATSGKSATTSSKDAGLLGYDSNYSMPWPYAANSSGIDRFNYSVSLQGYAQNGVPVSIQNKVTCTLHLHYIPTPGNPNDLPPQIVAVLLKGYTGGHYGGPAPEGYNGGKGSITGATGLTDKDPNIYPSRGITVDINGDMMATYPNPKRETDITLGPFTATGTGSLDNAWKTTTSTDWTGVSRSSTSVAGADTASDTSDDVWKLECLRNLDGSITVDSAATWNGYWRAGVNLTAITLGYPTPKYSWSVSGGTLTSAASSAVGQDSDQVNLNTSLSYIFLGGNTSSLSSTTSTATVKVSDTSGSPAPLSGSYAINWHMPRENWKQYGPTTQVWQQPAQCDVNAPGYAVYGGGVNVTYALTDDELWGGAVNDTWGALTSVIGSSVPPPYSTLFAAAGLYHPGTTPATVPVDFNSQWGLKDPKTGKDICTYSPYRDDTQKAFYQMVPELQEGYTTTLWKGEIYGSNGFGGIDKKAIQAPNGAQQWISTFTLQTPSTTPPPTHA